MNNLIERIDLSSFFVIITLFTFFFLWGLPINLFYIIILPIFLIILNKRNYQLIKKKYFLAFLIIYLVVFYFSLSQHELKILNFKQLLNLLGLPIVTIFCIYFREQIIKNLKNLVLLFSIIYFLTNIYGLILNYDTYNFSDINIFHEYRCHYFTSFLRYNYIFLENSHFGMIAVALSYYILYLISIESKKLLKFFLFITLISFLYNSSTTFFLGYIISFFAISICCIKQIKKQFLFLSSIFFIVILFLFYSSSTCMKRIQDFGVVLNTYQEISKIDDDNKLNIPKSDEIKNNKDEIYKLYRTYLNELETLRGFISTKKKNLISEQKQKVLKLELELKKLNAKKFELINKNLSTNLTTQVYLRSFYVLLKSIKEYPLGWGANNYNLASRNYRFDIPYINPDTIFLNSEDASNNFVKFITEFGIFGILILIFICIICLSSKIDYEVKLFFIPLIITQLIRGAGYYNGGFIFALNFLMILYIVNSKTYK